MNLKNLLFASVIVLSANAAIAQTPVTATHLVNISIPEVSLLDIKFTPSATSTSTAITLAGTAPTVAGEAMTFGPAATNSALWLNYSSIPKGGKERNITVKITDGVVPTGLKLTVQTTNSLTGSGKLGTIIGGAIDIPSKIATSATPLLTGIKSAYTGSGEGKGHNLTYKLGYATGESTDYAALDNTVVPALTITYTLSEI